LSIPRVLVSSFTFGEIDSSPVDLLKSYPAVYLPNPYKRKLTAEEMKELLPGVDGLIAGTEPLTGDVLAKATSLKVISRCGIGIDNIDLNAARELGIVVRHTVTGHPEAVAELILAGILDVLRSVSENDRLVRQGVWRQTFGLLLRGKTIGLIGLGRIGKVLTTLLQPFGTKLLAFDLQPDHQFAEAHGVTFTSLEDLLTRSDIVSLHIPYTPQSHFILNKERLTMMKEGAVLINCARGRLVDEKALYDLLKGGRLRGAFMDTFENEPYHGPLTELPNVVLTPHMGSATRESRLQMEIESVQNLLEEFDKIKARP